MGSASIFNALMQPQKSVLDYQEEYAQADDRKATRAFNALAMQEKQAALGDQARNREVQQRLQTGLQGLGTGASDDQRIGLYESLGQFDAADKIRQGIINRKKAETDAAGKTAENAAKFVSLQGDLAKRVQAAPTPENAMAAIQHMRSYAKLFGIGDIDLSNEERQIQAFQTPEQIQRWAAGHSLSAEKLLPQISSHNIGGATITQAVDPLTGKPQTTGTVANTQSPDNRASTGVQYAKLAEDRRHNAVTESNAATTLAQNGGGKMTQAQTSKISDAQDVLSLLDMADPLIKIGTSSLAGKAWDATAGAFGASSDSADAAAQLSAIEGMLISKMPKMSGPQSDKDVLLYKQMAGQIGDPTVPVSQKQAAAKVIRKINERYAGSASAPMNTNRSVPSIGKKGATTDLGGGFTLNQ